MDKSAVKVGFVTYNSVIHFYNVKVDWNFLCLLIIYFYFFVGLFVTVSWLTLVLILTGNFGSASNDGCAGCK